MAFRTCKVRPSARRKEEGVGEVIERDGGMEVEQPHRLVEQVLLDDLTVRHQTAGAFQGRAAAMRFTTKQGVDPLPMDVGGPFRPEDIVDGQL